AEELAGKLPSGPEIWSKAVGEHVRALRAELAAVCPWVAVLSKPMAALSRSPTREARAEANGPVLGIPNHTPNGPPPPPPGPSGSGLFPVRTEDAWAALLNELDTPAGVPRWAERLPVLQAELAGWAKGKPASGHEADAEALAEALARSKAADLALALEGLARRANAFADAMDFVFLYNATRNLFAIGYNVPLERLDPAPYDLLASEAAIASFLAVARGVVPRKHWFQLGRLATRVAGMPGLVSWGGTMFEYLMPRILLPAPPGTLLDTAQRAAVARQIEYGRQQHVPWGISESGFYVIDANSQDYQYQSFGVPGLGLKRGLSKDHVVAPYATLLAVTVNTHASVANLHALRALGGEGPFGFYEALDFTPDRLEKGDKCKVVKEYMAHHQGMALCA